MCNPALLIAGVSTGASIAAQMGAARSKNRAAAQASQSYVAQLAAQQAADMMKHSVAAGNRAREAYNLRLQQAEYASQINVRFGGLYGTPRTDAQRVLAGSSRDAFWALHAAGEVAHLEHKDSWSLGLLSTQAAINNLDTVSSGQQVMIAGVTAIDKFGGAWVKTQKRKPPSDGPVGGTGKSGGGLSGSSVPRFQSSMNVDAWWSDQRSA